MVMYVEKAHPAFWVPFRIQDNNTPVPSHSNLIRGPCNNPGFSTLCLSEKNIKTG
jgi:hypothetical protein